jgi:hypothetical protein
VSLPTGPATEMSSAAAEILIWYFLNRFLFFFVIIYFLILYRGYSSCKSHFLNSKKNRNKQKLFHCGILLSK